MPESDALPTALVLYQRDDCHLCDLALEVLAEARLPDFESVFIDGDEVLEARYGTRVPVLRDADRGAELDWPFDRDRLRRWCGALLAVAMPVMAWAEPPAASAGPDLDLVKSAGVVADWQGLELAQVLAGGDAEPDLIERIVLTAAVTSAPAGHDLVGVRRALADARGPSHGGRSLGRRLLAASSPNATWEGVLLMHSGTAYAFAIGGDEVCLQGPGGVRACWTLAGTDPTSLE